MQFVLIFPSNVKRNEILGRWCIIIYHFTISACPSHSPLAGVTFKMLGLHSVAYLVLDFDLVIRAWVPSFCSMLAESFLVGEFVIFASDLDEKLCNSWY